MLRHDIAVHVAVGECMETGWNRIATQRVFGPCIFQASALVGTFVHWIGINDKLRVH